MTPADLYAHFGLDAVTLSSSKARIASKKHAVRQALFRVAKMSDEEIATVEGLIRGRAMCRTTVYYSLHRAKPSHHMKQLLSEAKRLAKDVRFG